MIRIIAKLFAIAVALIAFLPVAPVHAVSLLTFAASTGNDSNPCTAALPCESLAQALSQMGSGGQVNCLNPPYGVAQSESTEFFLSFALTIDCPGVVETAA